MVVDHSDWNARSTVSLLLDVYLTKMIPEAEERLRVLDQKEKEMKDE